VDQCRPGAEGTFDQPARRLQTQLLLVARRRHGPDGESQRITQLEVAEAQRRGIDVLPFLLDDDAL
jgi:hypothetical protein